MQLALLFLPLLITGTALSEAEWEEDEKYEEEDDSQFAEVIVETDTALIRLSFSTKDKLSLLVWVATNYMYRRVFKLVHIKKKKSLVYFSTS